MQASSSAIYEERTCETTSKKVVQVVQLFIRPGWLPPASSSQAYVKKLCNFSKAPDGFPASSSHCVGLILLKVRRVGENQVVLTICERTKRLKVRQEKPGWPNLAIDYDS